MTALEGESTSLERDNCEDEFPYFRSILGYREHGRIDDECNSPVGVLLRRQ